MRQGCALGLALVGVAGMATTALAQSTNVSNDLVRSDLEEPQYRELGLHVDSGIVRVDQPQPGVRDVQVPIWEEVIEVPDAGWIRLRFSDVALAKSTERVRESYIRVTSLEDGYEQYLDADALRAWGNSTAYFNGNAVRVELMASPNATHQVNRVKIVGAQVSAPVVGPRSICGPTDDRLPSQDFRDARMMPVGCTAWLFSDHGSRMLTAGHCGVSGSQVIQFNVPLSTSGGSPRNPPPQDQYAVDSSSIQSNSGGTFIGNDWSYFGVFDNSNTGMSPGQSYGVWHNLAQSQIPSDGRTIRITGYGVTGGGVPASWNLAQKTHTGPLASVFGTTVRYVTDTTGGNSGSAILDEDNQVALGIHTNAGCGFSGGSNQGTSVFNSGLQTALDNPQGITQPRDIQASLVFEPTHIQPEGGDVVTLSVDNLQGHTIAQGPTMFVSVDGGSFVAQGMIDNGDMTFDGTFAPMDCGSDVDYYFEILDEEDTLVRIPSNSNFSTVALDDLTIAIEDDFETNQDWFPFTTGASGGFVRTIPVGHGLGDPDSDADGSGRCYVTSNNQGVDVDNGSVFLLSPLVDLRDIEEPVLRVSAWMTGTGPDSMEIQLTSNAGINFVTAATITSTNGQWDELSFNISDFVDLTAAFQMRVKVTDAGADTTVEGGIDAFKISSEICDGGGCPADITGDGVLDFFDVSQFLSAFNAGEPDGDFNEDGNFDFFDVSGFINAFGTGCP